MYGKDVLVQSRQGTKSPHLVQGRVLFRSTVARPSSPTILGTEAQRRGHETGFRLPFLWLGVALGGIYLSLDDITILHENLFWRETREVTSRLGSAWKYLTQWEIFFAPAILVTFGFYVRLSIIACASARGAWRGALAGLGFLGSVAVPRGVAAFVRLRQRATSRPRRMIEKELQMIGAIFLLGSIAFYALDTWRSISGPSAAPSWPRHRGS